MGDFNNGFNHPANRVDDELYRDVVEKFGGDHQRALEVLERLGMVTPPSPRAASPTQLSTSSATADDIYRDLLARSQGDHTLARAALRQLNLDLSQPRPSSHGCSGLHSPQPTTTVCGESSLHLRTVETATSLEQFTQGTTGRAPSMVGSASAAASAHHGVDDMFATERAPPFYVCPVSGIVMRDPVVLSSGRSYERRAIEHHLALQPHICPASRRPLESPVVLTPDHDLRANVQAWCAVNAPQLLDANGDLVPASFPVGIEHHITWVHDRQAASAMAALPPRPVVSLIASPRARRFDSPTAAELADSRLARQLQEDERRKGHYIVHTSGPGHGGNHKREPPRQLHATRVRVSLFGWTAAAVVLAWFAAFLWELSEGDWSFVNVNVNPWIGVSADALLSSGGTCSPCISDDREWWRLLVSLLLSAGVTQLLLNGAMLALWSHVCAHLGVPTLVYVAILAVAGVAASLVSAAAVEETVHTVSAAVPAAAMGVALAGTVAWGGSMRRGWLTVAVVLLCFASQVVVSLAPFADAWATVAGFVVGGLCALVFFVPNLCTVGGVLNKRLVLIWQALLTGLVVAVYLIAIFAVSRSPEERPRCPTCSSMSCVDMLDWSCAEARHNYGVCDYRSFANSTIGLTCPYDQRTNRSSVLAAGPMSTEQLDSWCSRACSPSAAAPPPPPKPTRKSGLAPPPPPMTKFAT